MYLISLSVALGRGKDPSLDSYHQVRHVRSVPQAVEITALPPSKHKLPYQVLSGQPPLRMFSSKGTVLVSARWRHSRCATSERSTAFLRNCARFRSSAPLVCMSKGECAISGSRLGKRQVEAREKAPARADLHAVRQQGSFHCICRIIVALRNGVCFACHSRCGMRDWQGGAVKRAALSALPTCVRAVSMHCNQPRRGRENMPFEPVLFWASQYSTYRWKFSLKTVNRTSTMAVHPKELRFRRTGKLSAL